MGKRFRGSQQRFQFLRRLHKADPRRAREFLAGLLFLLVQTDAVEYIVLAAGVRLPLQAGVHQRHLVSGVFALSADGDHSVNVVSFTTMTHRQPGGTLHKAHTRKDRHTNPNDRIQHKNHLGTSYAPR